HAPEHCWDLQPFETPEQHFVTDDVIGRNPERSPKILTVLKIAVGPPQTPQPMPSLAHGNCAFPMKRRSAATRYAEYSSHGANPLRRSRCSNQK
ncbi:MAG: hypothetical protein WA177_06680, partial [Xanthobacteraceae bacterium]